ncbi:MAG: hypothetical protein J6X98_08100, partial [Bacteroidales bacterium]|nr:hypothetical protein [Bacteroidales bacterium]
MKRTFTLFAAILFFAVGAVAQKLSYQAVVRNSANELVYNATVTVSLKILASDGVTVQYAETQTVTTNQNGLLNLIIGESSSATGSLSAVNWTNASIKTDITLPTGGVVTNVMPVTAVPYALYADDAGSSFSGNYNDLEGKPNIPTKTSDLTNDSGFLTEHQDISGKADIADIPTSTSQLTNDSGFLTAQDISGKANKSEMTVTPGTGADADKTTIQLKDGTSATVLTAHQDVSGFLTEHQDISGKADIADIPTSTSQLTNDSGFLTEHQDISGKANKSEMIVTPGTGENADKTTIQLKDGTSATVLTTHQDVSGFLTEHQDISGKADIADIPTSTSQLTNDSGFLTAQDISGKANKSEMTVTPGTGADADKTTIQLKDGTSATVLTTHQDVSGFLTEHQDISGKADIADIPTSTSQLTNDSGFLTAQDISGKANK